jgi:thiol-disulfide isomerase/thioredoxin
MRTRFLYGFILLLLASPLYAAQKQPPLGHELSRLPSPVPAPAFTLKDIDDKPHSLADYKGKVVLVNFWGTWCPPCRREMPSMERVYKHLHTKNFVVLAINQMETPDDVFVFTSQLTMAPTFPILFDKNSDIATAYQVKGLPTSYLIDKKGDIRFRAIGGREFDHPNVEKQIDSLINEQ